MSLLDFMGNRKNRRKQKQKQQEWNRQQQAKARENVVPFSQPAKQQTKKTIHAAKIIKHHSSTDQIVNVATEIFGGRYYCTSQDT